MVRDSNNKKGNNAGGGSSAGGPAGTIAEETPIITILTIGVKDQSGEEAHFKIKDDTKLSEVFEAYAERKGVQACSLRLLWKGTKVCPCLTPHNLGMRDRDQLDCVSPADLVTPIVIRVRDESGEETYFKIKQTTKMKKVFDKHAERRHVALSTLLFTRNGRQVLPEYTPVMMALRDGDKVECVHVESKQQQQR